MKLPWEHDPTDREASYQRPVPRIEVIRMASKLAVAAAAGIWLWLGIGDRCAVDEIHDVCRAAPENGGARLLVAVGATMTLAGVIDLLYLRRHEIELVFARSQKQQVAARIGMLAVGIAMLVAGIGRLS